MTLLDPEKMSLCPFCDNEMCSWQECTIFIFAGSQALAHTDCLEAAMSAE